jgi:5-(carboxyamino)imidazole ribonucleotide mutase
MTSNEKPLVAILMGSKSDWETMRHAGETLSKFGVASESRVLSAHRSPDALVEFVRSAEGRGVEILIAGAGGAAHLAGAVAANTVLPVLGVPIDSSALKGLDALLATVQMPAGVPVATFAIGKAGVVNAALQAVAILAGSRPELREKLKAYRREQASKILAEKLE